MAVLLYAATIDKLKPRADRYVVRDEKVSGLELRVAPDGSKSWSLRYRIHKQQRRLKLGEYPRVSLAQARTLANAELRKIDGGIDPQAEREAAARAVADAKRAAEQAKRNSIEALCDAYIEQHAKPTKRTWRADRGRLKQEVLTRWRRRPVTTITRRDCQELVQAIADRGAPIVANRVAALLSRLFRFAVDQHLIDANPAAHLPKPGVEAGKRPARDVKPYTPEEIRTIWQATEDLAPALRALYRLGLLTGQRPTEIADLEWGELDGSWWTIPARRTKNGRDHRVFLVPAAVDLLREIPRIDDEPKVFAGYRGKRQLATANATVFADVRRRQNPRHAMRDTVATGLAEAGVAIEDIAKVLNHTYGPRVTGVYNCYSYDREKRIAMGKWARRLAAILEQQETTTKVVAIGRG